MKRELHIIAKAAISLDGYIDDSSPERRVFSNALDAAQVDALRASCDAIFVGANTIRADNPRLLVRDEALREQRRAAGKSEDLVKATMTRSANLNPKSQFFATGSSEKVVYCDSDQAESLTAALGQSAEIVVCDKSQITPEFVCNDLARRGVERLLVEGGSKTIAQFLGAGLVDEFRLAIAPCTIADTSAPRLFTQACELTKMFALSSLEQLEDMSVLWFSRR